MSGKSRMKDRVRHIGRFATAPYWKHHALNLWAMVAALELTDVVVPAAVASGEPAYEHFLYLRHDLEGGTAKTDSLVLVRVTSDGFDARPVYSKRNLNIDWNPLGIRNGKLYAIRMRALITVDLHTGNAEQVDSGIQSWKWRGGKLYTFVQQASSHQASLLRVYDAETEAFRDIGVPPHPPPENNYWPGWPPEIEVSPDHKWVANFCRSTNVRHSYLHQLRLIGVDDGSVKTSEISVAAREFLGGDLFSKSSPPFCWLDSKTLLVVRDVSTNRFSMFWEDGDEGMADMILSRVDSDAEAG